MDVEGLRRAFSPFKSNDRGQACAVAVAAIILAVSGGPESAEPLFAQNADSAGAERPLLGVNADLASMTPEARERALKLLEDAGVTALRLPLDWSRIEPTRGDMHWAQIDVVLEAAARFNMRVLLTLERAPAWSRLDPPPPEHFYRCTPSATDAETAPPTDESDLARFAAEVVRRRPEVWAIEVWREPNLHPHWRSLGPDPEDYAELLGAVADAIHAEREDVLVVSAGLAPTTDLSPCAISDVVFLDRLARTGVLDSVDAVGIEPFGLREGADDRRSDREILNFARAHVLAEVLERHTISAPLWAVAWGWRANAGDQEDLPSPWGGYPPDEAARNLRRGWAIARTEMPWMGPMFVWHLSPTAVSRDLEIGFALVDDQVEPTRLFDALAAIGSGAPAPSAETESIEVVESLKPRYSVLAGLSAAVAALSVLAGLAFMGLRQLPPVQIRRVVGHGERAFERTYVRLAWFGAIVLNALCVRALGQDVTQNALIVAIALSSSGVVIVLGLGFALFRPTTVLASIFAMAPFFYAIRLSIGTRAVGPVELLIAIAIVGALARSAANQFVGPPARRAETRSAIPWSGRCEHLGSPETASTAQPTRDRAMGETPVWQRIEVVLVCALAVWSGASITWAEVPQPAFREWRTVILEPILVYILIRSQGRVGLRAALDGFVFGAVIVATAGLGGVLYAGIVGEGAVRAEGVVRASGPYSSPNNLALWLGRAVAATAAYVVVARRSADGVLAGRARLYLLALVPLSLGLFATFSRGAFIFGMVATAAYLIALAGGGRLRWRPIAFAAAAVLCIGFAILPFAGTDRVRETLSIAPGTTGYIRLHLWTSAFEMGRDHPWLGVGLDNFLPLYRDRYVHREVIEERFLGLPHNAVLDWWTRLGAIGISMFAGLAWLALRRWNAIIRPSGLGVPEAASGLALIIYALAHGMVDVHFFLVDLALAWWLGLALVVERTEVDATSLGEPDAD